MLCCCLKMDAKSSGSATMKTNNNNNNNNEKDDESANVRANKPPSFCLPSNCTHSLSLSLSLTIRCNEVTSIEKSSLV